MFHAAFFAIISLLSLICFAYAAMACHIHNATFRYANIRRHMLTLLRLLLLLYATPLLRHFFFFAIISSSLVFCRFSLLFSRRLLSFFFHYFYIDVTSHVTSSRNMPFRCADYFTDAFLSSFRYAAPLFFAAAIAAMMLLLITRYAIAGFLSLFWLRR